MLGYEVKLTGIKIPKKTTRLFYGIDPGAAGGFAALNQDGGEEFSYCFKDKTERDIFNAIYPWLLGEHGKPVFLYIEKVHAMPKQGVASSFNFGVSFGLVRGFVIASRVPWDEVTPSKWQREMRCQSGGDKSIPMDRAQRLWPDVKMNKTGRHQVYDALLVAEYCRRSRLGIPFH